MNGLIARRAMMAPKKGGGGHRLPADYQEVEWLSSDGNPYIMGPKVYDGVGYIAEIDAIVADVRDTLCGVFGYNSGGQVAVKSGKISNERVTSNVVWNTRKVITSRVIYSEGYSYLYEGDVEIANRVYGYISDQTGKSVGIFAMADWELRYGYSAIATIYGIRIYAPDGVTLRYELIPCYRKSDNVAGMYDLCGSICPLTNSPFYINAGTGEFNVGPDVI